METIASSAYTETFSSSDGGILHGSDWTVYITTEEVEIQEAVEIQEEEEKVSEESEDDGIQEINIFVNSEDDGIEGKNIWDESKDDGIVEDHTSFDHYEYSNGIMGKREQNFELCDLDMAAYSIPSQGFDSVMSSQQTLDDSPILKCEVYTDADEEVNNIETDFNCVDSEDQYNETYYICVKNESKDNETDYNSAQGSEISVANIQDSPDQEIELKFQNIKMLYEHNLVDQRYNLQISDVVEVPICEKPVPSSSVQECGVIDIGMLPSLLAQVEDEKNTKSLLDTRISEVKQKTPSTCQTSCCLGCNVLTKTNIQRKKKNNKQKKAPGQNSGWRRFPYYAGKKMYTCKWLHMYSEKKRRLRHFCTKCERMQYEDHFRLPPSCCEHNLNTLCSRVHAEHLVQYHNLQCDHLTSLPEENVKFSTGFIKCHCGVVHVNGDKMADHLIVCGQPTCKTTNLGHLVKASTEEDDIDVITTDQTPKEKNIDYQKYLMKDYRNTMKKTAQKNKKYSLVPFEMKPRSYSNKPGTYYIEHHYSLPYYKEPFFKTAIAEEEKFTDTEKVKSDFESHVFDGTDEEKLSVHKKHNFLERRRRKMLGGQFLELRNLLPKFCADICKVTKIAILMESVLFINELKETEMVLEKEKADLLTEQRKLQLLLQTLEDG